MGKFFKYLFGDVTQDREGNFHKQRCHLRNERFTVIVNRAGKKMCDGYVKYCPCCGEKLDGRKG